MSLVQNDSNIDLNYERRYTYKSTINIRYWNKQLRTINSKLTRKEIELFENVRNEKENNDLIKKIYQYALKDGLYIPKLSSLSGNCMFESMEYVGLCKNYNEFRKSIAILFFLFGECENVIPGNNMKLKDIFKQINNIEYVYCKNTNLLYQYTYYTMCSDMFNDGSWCRLPTELILMLISIFFKVKIHIYHDNGYITTICNNILNNSDDQYDNIYLGLLDEHHYIPLIKKKQNHYEHFTKSREIICPKYVNELKKFHIWAQHTSDLVGLYEDCKINDY